VSLAAYADAGMSDVTQILSQIEQGDPAAAEQLLPLVYDELRRLAAAKLSQEKPGQTLQATALVHEAYLRLVGEGSGRYSGWSTSGVQVSERTEDKNRESGIRGGISLGRRRRRCGGFWSNVFAAIDG